MSDAAGPPLDCLVVGGGPGGLTAALYLARFRRRVRVIHTGASRANWIPRSHNLPAFPDGLHGVTLMERLTEQALAHGADIRQAKATALKLTPDGGFLAEVGGEQVAARTVLLATGVVETVPAIPGVEEAILRSLVRVCPICDGFEAQGRRVGVLGSGDHAAGEALFLRAYAADVTLVLTPEAVLEEAVHRTLDEAGVRVLHTRLESVAVEADRVSAVCTEGERANHFDILYAAFGVTAQTRLVRGLGVELDATGRVRVRDHQQTAVPGLYAAGDVVRGLNQICVAEGEAAVAATHIHNRLPRKLA